MSDTKWTAGEWTVLPGHKCGFGVDAHSDHFIKEVVGFEDEEARYGSIHSETDAHLIAAAPDLYAALHAFYATSDAPPAILKKAHEALAKARGES